MAAMQIDLTDRVALHAVWDALQQYIDNNDPEDVEVDERSMAMVRKHAAACELCDTISAHIAGSAT